MNGFEEVKTNEKFEDRELEWDDFVENDSPDFVLLPEGDYDFQVVDFERGRHNGSEKLPPCNKAIVHIKVEGPQGVAIIRHQLFLHTKTEGMLCAFFTGIGMRKKGEKVQMKWNAVVGAKGRAKIGIRIYKKDGEERKYNEIKKFYEPTDIPAPTINQKTTFEAGKF